MDRRAVMQCGAIALVDDGNLYQWGSPNAQNIMLGQLENNGSEGHLSITKPTSPLDIDASEVNILK